MISKLDKITVFHTFLAGVLVFAIEPKITNFECHTIKGQLISKFLFGVIVSTKLATKIL